MKKLITLILLAIGFQYANAQDDCYCRSSRLDADIEEVNLDKDEPIYKPRVSRERYPRRSANRRPNPTNRYSEKLLEENYYPYQPIRYSPTEAEPNRFSLHDASLVLDLIQKGTNIIGTGVGIYNQINPPTYYQTNYNQQPPQ